MVSANCPPKLHRRGQYDAESCLIANIDLKYQRWNLIIHGLLLLILGLMISDGLLSLTGKESRQSAQLVPYMNGLFLICLGVIWPRLLLPPKWRGILFKAIIFGTWLKWYITLATGLYANAERLVVDMTYATDWLIQLRLVDVSLLSLTGALVIISLYLALGLRRREAEQAGSG